MANEMDSPLAHKVNKPNGVADVEHGSASRESEFAPGQTFKEGRKVR